MVFKHKQPPPSPRLRISPRDVARTFGVDVDTVMAALAGLGEYVSSPASKVEEPVTRGSTKRWAASTSQRGRRRRLSGREKAGLTECLRRGARPRVATGAVRPTGSLQQEKIGGRRRMMHRLQLILNPGSCSDLPRSNGMLGLRTASGPDKRKMPSYREAGLMPTDLPMNPAGWTVMKRLRAGENPTDVVRLLETTQRENQAG